MEEKLYFKPETSGKKKKKKKDRRFLKLFFFLLFLVFVVLVIIWLLRGRETVSGRYPANVTNESLECLSSIAEYSKIDPRDAEATELRLTAVFGGSGKLNSLSLRYILTYDTPSDAISSEAVNHATFGTGLANVGLSFTQFENKFTLLDNVLEVSLHATSSDINEYTADYFMIDSKNGLPTSLEDYRKSYESLGFKCKTGKE